MPRQYGCYWETINKRLNSDNYKKEKRIHTSKLDNYKTIIDEKI